MMPKVKIKLRSKTKIAVLKNASLFYNKWIDMYKKEYEQVLEDKDENWRKKSCKMNRSGTLRAQAQ